MGRKHFDEDDLNEDELENPEEYSEEYEDEDEFTDDDDFLEDEDEDEDEDEGEYEEELAESGTEEADVECPYCGEGFSIVVDCSVDRQAYVEDCQICCRPITFSVECEDGLLMSVNADRDD